MTAFYSALKDGKFSKAEAQKGMIKNQSQSLNLSHSFSLTTDYDGTIPLHSSQTPMAKAIWNGAVLAESDQYEIVEGNVYFPPDKVNMQYLQPSSTHTTCPWKGTASYYTAIVDGKENKDCAWYYPDVKPSAKQIKGFVAFWRGVQVIK